MSGYSAETAGVRNLLDQKAAFLTKPIEPTVLLEQIRTVVDMPLTSEEPFQAARADQAGH